MEKEKNVTMLMILDGYGINEKIDGNAIKQANTPNLDEILVRNPNTIIHTSGSDVGLPDGQMGNSQAAESNLSAGRVVVQNLTKINKSIEKGDFFSIPEFTKAIENCKKHNSKLHLIGLVSDGGVHSHTRHLYGLLEMAKRKGFENVFVHCFMDGRDTAPASGENYIIDLEEKMREKGLGKIATISGRYYAMDRDNNWDRIEKVYNAMVKGEGEKSNSAVKAVEESYQRDKFDEFISPTVITGNDGKPVAKIEKNDSVIFFNFRADRAIELTKSIAEQKFNGFKRNFFKTFFVCMTNYDDELTNVEVAFKNEKIKNTFEEYLSSLEMSILKIKENREVYGKDLINSVQDATDRAIDAINSKNYDSIILKYTSLDIAGHTGSMDITVKVLEYLDECILKIVEAIKKNNGTFFLTSYQGNAEQMIDYQTGEPYTAHTLNPVPLVMIGKINKNLKEGKLSDLAPTMLEVMGVDKPIEMTGNSLLV